MTLPYQLRSLFEVRAMFTSVWQRNASLPAQSLDTPKLVNSLEQIRELIDLAAIGQYRTPTYYEESSVALLHLLTNYYAKLQN